MIRANGYLSPMVIQVAGLLLLLASFVYFGITQKPPIVFVGAAVSLIAYGGAGGAVVSFRQDIKQRGEDKIGQVEEAAKQ